MSNKLIFLKEYWTNTQETGSVIPDSDALVEALLEHAPFRSAKMILEYGPGSGLVLVNVPPTLVYTSKGAL